MVQWADWALPHGSFLAATEGEQERIKLKLFGCFLLGSNEGIKTASARIMFARLFLTTQLKPMFDWLAH